MRTSPPSSIAFIAASTSPANCSFLCMPPKVIIRNVPAEKAGLAVSMDPAFDCGAISIVLDNSGSMNFVHPEKDPKDKDALQTGPRGKLAASISA